MRIEDAYEASAWREYRAWVAGSDDTGRDDGVVERAMQAAGGAAAAVGSQVWSSVRDTRGGDALQSVTTSARSLWASDRVQRGLDEVVAAVEGAYGTAVEAALQTVDPAAVLEHYRPVVSGDRVEDLQEVPLRLLDRHRPPVPTRFTAQFTMSGGLAGAAQGATSVTGVLAGGVLVGDVVATIALSVRGIATMLAHHGHDVTRPSEHAYVLTVLQAATAESPEERELLAAQAIDLGGRRRLGELDENVISTMAQAAFTAAVQRLARKRLARFVPGVSGVVGAGSGYRHGRAVMEAAHFAGRARLLRARWGEPATVDL